MALPDVGLPSNSGASVRPARWQGSSVLVIYPWTGRPGVPNPPGWDDIPGAHGSTPQLEGFRDLAAEFAARRVAIFAISTQASPWQQELAARLGLPFPILSDKDLTFADALHLPRFTTGGETYLKRLTLVCESGVIRRTIYPVHPPDTHARELLATLEPGPI